MIKILADECVHADLISALREANLDVVTATEIGLSLPSALAFPQWIGLFRTPGKIRLTAKR